MFTHSPSESPSCLMLRNMQHSAIHHVICVLLFLSATTLSLATQLTLHIPASPILPQPAALPPSTIASLTTISTSQSAHLNSQNSFRFRNVSSGSYLLSITCATHAFPPLRADVSADGKVEAWKTFRGNEWENKGEEFGVGDGNVLEVKALGTKGYYMERQGFSPLSLLKNPMILIAGFGMLMVFGMPYLLENMDPEMRAEFEERQKSSSANALLPGSQQNPLGNFDAAAWLAGSGKKSEEDSSKTVEKGISR